MDGAKIIEARPRRNSRPGQHRPTFTLRLEGKPGAAGIRQLRAILKTLLRKYHFRCVHCVEEDGGAS